MTEIEAVVIMLHSLADQLGYPKTPGYQDPLPYYDFGRKIAIDQPHFWREYGAFVRLADGFEIDGTRICGIESDEESSEYNRLKDNNDWLTLIPELYDERMDGLIVIGENGTDTFVYDTASQRFEARDRIRIEDAYSSYGTLAELLAELVKRLMDAEQ
ncbi:MULTISPECIES: YrhA family protein [unclassified Brenneria]|uniref:YrhA family protein n=1 Tax=unclassified Brenneria TaxID=2634434 RepID=UPI0029C5EF2B|nr:MULTISPECIES: YrhA family protein [unclassified Brenneria]MDX5629320.1 YrhA family protein [Brenneria sp. L3-3Z]MDX5696517.1 YrhA family protein [Brenneria sp. L4-2C]